MDKQKLIVHIQKADGLVKQYISDKKEPVLNFLKDKGNSLDDRWEIFCSLPDSWLKQESWSCFDPEVLTGKCFYDMGVDRHQTVDVRDHLNGFVTDAPIYSYHEGYNPDTIHNTHSGKTAGEWLIEYKEEAMTNMTGSFIHDW